MVFEFTLGAGGGGERLVCATEVHGSTSSAAAAAAGCTGQSNASWKGGCDRKAGPQFQSGLPTAAQCNHQIEHGCERLTGGGEELVRRLALSNFS